jgi:hypothetical protein
MPESRQSKRAPFEEVRSAFEKLETQDKVAFVVEATFTTLADAFELAGRELGSVIEDLADQTSEAFGKRTGKERPSGGAPTPPRAAAEDGGPEIGAPRGEVSGAPRRPPKTPD